MQPLKESAGTPPSDIVAFIHCLAGNECEAGRSACTPARSSSTGPWMILTTPQGDQLWIEQQLDRQILAYMRRIRELGLPLALESCAHEEQGPDQLFRMPYPEGRELAWGITPASPRTPLVSPRVVVPHQVLLWLSVVPGNEGDPYLVPGTGWLLHGGREFAITARQNGDLLKVFVEEHMCAEENIPVRICLGNLELSVAQLAAIQPGGCFEFSLPRELAVIVQCNGVDWALGNLTLGEHGGVGALTITQQLRGNSDYSSEDTLQTGDSHG